MQPPIDPFVAPPCHEQIEVLYEDEHLLLINKPSKLLSLSGKHPANLDSVHYRLVQDYPSALMVHRLDLGTSGIMVIALNKEINKALCQQFSDRSITKTYHAILYGHVADREGSVSSPIAKGEFPLQKICNETGKPATTAYEVLAYEGNHTRVEFKPLTGRTHQLRIHSQQMGHPILGCDLYGNEDSYNLSDRLMLHASSLEFIHPVTGQPVIVSSPCPF